MKKRIIIIIFLLGISLNSQSQNVFINYDIDTTLHKVGEPLKLWLDFLNTKDDSLGSKYWSQTEVEKYGIDSYFLLEDQMQFGTDNYLELLSYTDIKVLSIRKVENYYKITTLMEFKPKDEKSNIQYIFHVYAGQEYGKLKLFNPLEINTKLHLNSTTVGYIRFHYPKMHEFNYELAQKQNDFLLDFSKNFDVPIDTIDYYFAPTNEEIQRIKGFDFLIGDNGNQFPSGMADSKNRIAYSTGLAEYYPHEMIHILINPHYPNCHGWFNEGTATFFGMSRGKELDWHLAKVNQHLIKHPEIDLNNMLELSNMDESTNYKYALGGFIIREAFKKGGYDLVKTFLHSGKSELDFYNAIERYLGIKQKNLNSWIRKELKATYSKK